MKGCNVVCSFSSFFGRLKIFACVKVCEELQEYLSENGTVLSFFSFLSVKSSLQIECDF